MRSRSSPCLCPVLILLLAFVSAKGADEGTSSSNPQIAVTGERASGPEAGRSAGLAFVLYAGNGTQERKAAALIGSIRKYGGRYAGAPIYVAIDERARVSGARLKGEGVHLVPLEMDEAARGYPFAQKVYAAAQVEPLIESWAHTLLWIDPENLVLRPPEKLDLRDGKAVAFRPVHLLNAIGLPPDQPIDPFWFRIYHEARVDPGKVPLVESSVDAKKVRFYINCGVIAYRPSKGICREWARIFSALIRDEGFQRVSCPEARHKVFLHQAILSAVILSHTAARERRQVPIDHGYPLNLHETMPPERRARKLNDLACVIFDTLWDLRPDWMNILPSDEPLHSWLVAAYRGTLAVTDRIDREEGQCNTYVVRTAEGSVVIDPGGASDPKSRLLALPSRPPVRAILLTHGHPDHRAGISPWKGDLDIPVIAQRRHADLLRDQDLIAGLLAARNAILNGQPVPAPAPPKEPTPIEPTVFFDDSYVLQVGDLRFQIFHAPSETPDASIVWIPELKAAFVGDVYFPSFPNLSTLRGAKPRWALDYVAALERTLSLEPDLLLPGHDEPVVGRDEVRRRLRDYRDAILHVHDATVRGLNEGKDVFTLMREITLPERFDVGQFFGRISWSVRGIYEGYVGWYDGDPANMYPQPPSAAYADLARLAGGAAAVARRAMEVLEEGDAVRALRLADAALAAEPGDPAALEARIAALVALRGQSRNYFERGFLGDAIRGDRERLERARAAAR